MTEAADPVVQEAEGKAVDAQGQILIRLDGADFVLRPSRRAISAIEKKLGRGLMALAQDSARGDLTTDDLAVIVVEMMRAYVAMNADVENADTYRSITVDRCAELIHESGFGGVIGRVTILLAGALMGGYTAAGELKPTR